MGGIMNFFLFYMFEFLGFIFWCGIVLIIWIVVWFFFVVWKVVIFKIIYLIVYNYLILLMDKF